MEKKVKAGLLGIMGIVALIFFVVYLGTHIARPAMPDYIADTPKLQQNDTDIKDIQPLESNINKFASLPDKRTVIDDTIKTGVISEEPELFFELKNESENEWYVGLNNVSSKIFTIELEIKFNAGSQILSAELTDETDKYSDIKVEKNTIQLYAFPKETETAYPSRFFLATIKISENKYPGGEITNKVYSNGQGQMLVLN